MTAFFRANATKRSIEMNRKEVNRTQQNKKKQRKERMKKRRMRWKMKKEKWRVNKLVSLRVTLVHDLTLVVLLSRQTRMMKMNRRRMG